MIKIKNEIETIYNMGAGAKIKHHKADRKSWKGFTDMLTSEQTPEGGRRINYVGI